MLTDKDKKIISQMVSDVETGNHLLRTVEGWNELGIKRLDAIKYAHLCANAIDGFNLTKICDGEDDKRLTEVALYTAMCYSHDFYELAREVVNCFECKGTDES